MRVGIVVDGDSEYRNLRLICSRIRRACGHDFEYALSQTAPQTPIGALAKDAAKKAMVLVADKKVASVIFCLDLEDRNVCPGDFSREVAASLSKYCPVEAAVVVKTRMFENWLVADPEAFGSLPARFDLSKTALRSIVPDKADHVDALSILARAAIGDSYSKVSDSAKILNRADPESMALNSRSFRRFLRVVGHPSYLEQSARPTAG